MSPGTSKVGKKFKKNRKNKIHLVFDEKKRTEFLTGFHKRKLQRKKKAQEELEQQLKEERKRLKTEARESYKKLVTSYKPIPELENLLADRYEDVNVIIKVAELSTKEIARQNNWIGPNQPKYESEEESSEHESEKEEMPGMELKTKPAVKVKVEKRTFSDAKEVKKLLKKSATKNVQKSKAFQMKNKIERQKQKKKSLQVKRHKLKSQTKLGKRKKGNKKE